MTNKDSPTSTSFSTAANNNDKTHQDISQFVQNLLQEAGVKKQDPAQLAKLRQQLDQLGDGQSVSALASQQDLLSQSFTVENHPEEEDLSKEIDHEVERILDENEQLRSEAIQYKTQLSAMRSDYLKVQSQNKTLQQDLDQSKISVQQLQLENQRLKRLQTQPPVQLNHGEVERITKELSKERKLHKETREELEVLKLKLLAYEKDQEEAEQYTHHLPTCRRYSDKQVSTRNLIKRDKMRYYSQLKEQSPVQQKQEVSPNISAQKVLDDICSSLNLSSIDRLVESLQDIATAIEKIPQMKKFITDVQGFVWSDQQRHSLQETLQRLGDLILVKDSDDVNAASLDSLLEQVQ